MKKFISIILFSLICLVSIEAQVVITEDINVSSLLQRHIDQNRMSTSISGWRIQLMATADRRKVEKEEASFTQNHPFIRVNWEHAKPYYKLKAGAFATKLDATKTLKELKKDYPSAILTKSDVFISEVLNF